MGLLELVRSKLLLLLLVGPLEGSLYCGGRVAADVLRDKSEVGVAIVEIFPPQLDDGTGVTVIEKTGSDVDCSISDDAASLVNGWKEEEKEVREVTKLEEALLDISSLLPGVGVDEEGCGVELAAVDEPSEVEGELLMFVEEGSL